MMQRIKQMKAIGWTRHGSGKGDVSKYHIKDVCNCITTFCGGVDLRTQPPAWLTLHRMY